MFLGNEMNTYLWIFNRENGRIKNKTYNVEQISTKPNFFYLERGLVYNFSEDQIWVNTPPSHSIILYKIPTEHEIEKLKKAVFSIKE